MKRTSWRALLVATGAVLAVVSSARAEYHPTLGRWLQRDPIGYADGMGLYEYVGGRPVVMLDPQGLGLMGPTDPGWGHNDAPGSSLIPALQAHAASYGPDTYLVFDGRKLCLVSPKQAEGCKCRKCWKARSGHPKIDEQGNVLNEPGTDIPQFPELTRDLQGQVGKGPIPEGSYSFSATAAQDDPSSHGIWTRADWNKYDRERHPWQTNVNPRPAGPWGEAWARLKPSGGTDTYGRKDFNIHGGRKSEGGNWGSGGCIDLMEGDTDFRDHMLERGGAVNVTVDYGGGAMPKDCKEPKGTQPWVRGRG